MMTRGEHSKTKKWIIQFMAFAFFWLVLGDLIVLHQKIIYSFDPFHQHIPFTKTDNSAVKTKNDKGSKIEKSKDQYHYDATLNCEFNFKTTLIACETEQVSIFLERVSRFYNSEISLRAPPRL